MKDDVITIEKSQLFPPPRDRRCPFDPPPQAVEWSTESWIKEVSNWDGRPAWFITGYEECRALLADERTSVDPRNPGYPEKSAAFAAGIGQDRNLRTLDPPEHGVQKRVLVRDFTAKRVEELRPSIQQKIDSVIDQLLAKGPPADFHEGFSLPVPTLVICELLGVPHSDSPFFSDRSSKMISCLSSPSEVIAAGRDLYDYLERLVEKKRNDQSNDLLSRLAVELNEGRLTRKDTVELARFILIAGHETTANMISLSTLALLRHPDQLELMKSDSALVPNAVDELLRYLSISHSGRRRVATQDIEFKGVTIKAGDGLIIANHIADRDERVFPNAGRLDILRPNARANIAFGYGVHQCLGQLLSRVELQIVHQTIWNRIPTLALAVPFERIVFREDGPVYALDALPVTW